MSRCENLQWHLTRSLDGESEKRLTNLIATLTRFAMLFGGFGKSWRRSDHRLFFPKYKDLDKKLIGCHWDWLDHEKDNKVTTLSKVKRFINHTRETAASWMRSQKVEPLKSEENFVDWREAWHPDNVMVWGRDAEFDEDCIAIRWLHHPYQKSDPKFQISQKTIKQSSLTGSLNQIGCLWHRMYPITKEFPSQNNPEETIKHERFLELLVIFPDDSKESDRFLEFLRSHPDGFELLWGNE